MPSSMIEYNLLKNLGKEKVRIDVFDKKIYVNKPLKVLEKKRGAGGK